MQSSNPLTTAAIYIVIAALVGFRIYRMSKPSKISIGRMWTVPIIFAILTAGAAYGTLVTTSLAWWVVALFVFAGFVLSIPFGILRGRHTTVKATEKPGVMYLEANWVVPVLFVVAFGARFAIRLLMPHGEIASAVGDGLIAFLLGMMGVSYYVIYRKYRALEHEAGQI